MARDEVGPEVYRSGTLYVVKHGTEGILIRGDGTVSAPVLWGSLLAHVHVSAPWDPVDLDGEEVPAVVKSIFSRFQAEQPAESAPDDDD